MAMASDRLRVYRSMDLNPETCFARSYADLDSLLSFSRCLLAAREVALFHPDILSAPDVSRPPFKVWIVQSEHLKQDSELERRVAALGLRPSACGSEDGHCPPPADVWSSALRFSIQSRLSPKWNRVGCYLVRDRDFLLRTRLDSLLPVLRPESARLDRPGRAGGDHHHLILTLEGCCLTWSRLELVHLGVSPAKMEDYGRKAAHVIPQPSIGRPRLRVLPNLTRGRVVSITRVIEPSEEIRNWEEMRRYWKNMYGYRLPRDESEIRFYCNVSFEAGNATTLFCYPDLCVRPDEPVRSFEPGPLAEHFLDDLKDRVPAVCGMPLDFSLPAVAKAAAGRRRSSPAPAKKRAKVAPGLKSIPEMTADGTLSKATVASLVSWLRIRGVACKLKERKRDLMEKVLRVVGPSRRSDVDGFVKEP